MTRDSDSSADRELVSNFLRTRSEAAFLRLYDRHSDALYRFAARLSGGPNPEAAELTQEAWLRAIEGLSGFRFESSLKTWLCGIVFNRWREVRKRAARDFEFQVIEGSQAPEVSQMNVSGPALSEALGQLPDGYRSVLLLHDVEGFTHEEIASRFGIALGTSKSQLHRARRALRQALEGRRSNRK